ncbi:MAG: gamma-D-glutamyl-L-lysine dipeptidyl-peptidase [Actinomycetota bacterium]|jgi:cell wall-associated NlpC family hydrolase|nr:gamma-D-glutamyl-L-lysine dipeptidyl-peptidase [Actinomycetota bacterium]
MTIPGVNGLGYVAVPITALWTSPTAARSVDRWAVEPVPDVPAWLADLDAATARSGLYGRVLTQLEYGEPVLIIGDADGLRAGQDSRLWLQIAAPMQPSSLDERGYPGWVPAEHIGQGVVQVDDPSLRPADGNSGTPEVEASAEAFIAVARAHLGVPYLWGGTCRLGLDCSGLVHLSLRRLGIVVPRDTVDLYDACEHLPAAEAVPGDLLFFAQNGERPHHVGIVTEPDQVLHSVKKGSLIVEGPLSASRRSTLIGAGRLSFQPPLA